MIFHFARLIGNVGLNYTLYTGSLHCMILIGGGSLGGGGDHKINFIKYLSSSQPTTIWF